MPPLPGRPELRQKKGKRATHAILSADHNVQVPPLPDRGEPWHEHTVQWWRDTWRSPMSPQFTESDIHGLAMLAVLRDDFWKTPANKPRQRAVIASEIRLQEQRFGLSPIDRNRLSWTVEQADAAEDRGRRRRARTLTAVDPDDDPRNLLGKEWP